MTKRIAKKICRRFSSSWMNPPTPRIEEAFRKATGKWSPFRMFRLRARIVFPKFDVSWESSSSVNSILESEDERIIAELLKFSEAP